MDFEEQVTKWVEKKIAKIIYKDLKDRVVEENSFFDVDSYVNILLKAHFNENCAEQLKEIFTENSYDDSINSDLEYLTEEQNSFHDSLEFNSNENKAVIEEEIIKNLDDNSREVKKKYLKILEASAEHFVNHTSWNLIAQSLQKVLIKTKDKELYHLVLKIFQKLLKFSQKPQVICKGFTGIVKLTAKQIVLFNAENRNILLEQNSSPREGKHQRKNILEYDNFWHRGPKSQPSPKVEVLLKLMWLLIDYQQHMPMKCGRFNESRFREIIFSFMHLLSSTTVLENKTLSGLELLSVLNPTATWCRYYCHTATGRSLLCSALKKYKAFFTYVVEIILDHIRIKKLNKLPANKSFQNLRNGISKVLKPVDKVGQIGYGFEKHQNRTAHAQQRGSNTIEDQSTNKQKNSTSDWIVKGIPRRVVTEAMFCHSVFFVTCLIQFRSGRALFPLQIPTRKRLLSIQDFFFYLTEYLESSNNCEWDSTEVNFTSTYKVKLLEIVDSLKNLKINIDSVRSVEKQPFSVL